MQPEQQVPLVLPPLLLFTPAVSYVNTKSQEATNEIFSFLFFQPTSGGIFGAFPDLNLSIFPHPRPPRH